MALWTPYADDAPLDLSKTAVSGRRFTSGENHAQLPVPPDYLPYGYTQLTVPVPEYVVPYSAYYEQLGHVSPGGSSSGYDSVSFSPTQAHLPAFTPPTSPVDGPAKRPYHMIDADTLSDDPDFQEFERNALRVMAEKNGGALLGNNPRMRRAVRSTHEADDAYRRQRERNNHAAKQSRDRRKLREIHLALKVSYLKKEVATLKAALSSRVCGRCQQPCLC